MTTDLYSQVPDISMTTDADFSVGTDTSSPIAYHESDTTEGGELRGVFVTHAPWVTTMVPSTSFLPTVEETVDQEIIVVDKAQPKLGHEVPRDNVSIGEWAQVAEMQNLFARTL